uniref:Uncharacterized protein n=1 Tax=Leersia perrieri TaxID=77586 RepID=A0A0D9XNJ0_9ORYZ
MGLLCFYGGSPLSPQVATAPPLRRPSTGRRRWIRSREASTPHEIDERQVFLRHRQPPTHPPRTLVYVLNSTTKLLRSHSQFRTDLTLAKQFHMFTFTSFPEGRKILRTMMTIMACGGR